MKKVVKKKKVCHASVLKPSSPPVKNYNDSWDHTYVQKPHEASTYFEEMCSDNNISIDPSSYMIQTLSVDENIVNEPNFSKSNEIGRELKVVDTWFMSSCNFILWC